MEESVFWKSYGLVTLLIIVCLYLLDLTVPPTEAFNAFSMITIACFSGVMVYVYYRSQVAIRSTDQFRFVRLMLMLFLVKFFLCVFLVAIFWKVRMPDNREAVLPFLMIYIFYTIFEVWFLSKIARESPGKMVDEQSEQQEQ